MQITLTNTGKRYNREWIFRHVNYTFFPAKTYAITGANGSGKSTLLQVIAGAVMHSEGLVEYSDAGYGLRDKNVQHLTGSQKDSNLGIMYTCNTQHLVSSIQHPVSSTDAHKYISFSAPYLELIEEMTATELLKFHSTFKTLIKPVSQILEEVNLEKSAHKQIRYFSSGMKQRLKLAQAFFSDTAVLLLDEPATNLDEDGIVLYHRLINQCVNEKMIIISSNDKQEYDFCEEVIELKNYK